MSDVTDNYDSPWKEALEHFFPDFLAFFFPDAYGDIDWSWKRVATRSPPW